jgi:hypothetical protein
MRTAQATASRPVGLAAAVGEDSQPATGRRRHAAGVDGHHHALRAELPGDLG